MNAVARIEFPLTPIGVDQAQGELDEIRRLVSRERKTDPDSPAKPVFARSAGERSREVLRLLQPGKGAALTPSELASRMGPDHRGKPISKASARAAIRNIQRCEYHLLKSGKISRRLIQIDWNDYDRLGAGKYYLRAADKRVLHDLMSKRKSRTAN